jgi:putative MATE family efflux protein
LSQSAADGPGTAVEETASTAASALEGAVSAPASTPRPGGSGAPADRAARLGVQPRFDELTMDAPTVRRLVFSLAGPSIIDNLLVTLVQMADMIMVGRLGADAIAAVGLSNQPMFFALASFMALNVGTTALVARQVGAREYEDANASARQSLVLCALLGLVIGICGIFFAPQILAFMGAEEDAMARGVPYMMIITAGLPFNTVSMNLASVMRGAGDTKTPMKVHLVSNITNVVFNYILIYGKFGFPRLECAGAAWATLLSRVVACVLMIATLSTGRFIIALHRRADYRPKMDTVRRIMKVGLPAAVEQFIMRGGQMLFVRIVASLGTVVYAAHQVALNVESLSFMPGWGFAAAATSLVGQGLGAKRPDWSERLAKGSLRYAVIVASGMGVLFYTAGRPIAALYTDLPEVATASAMCLRLVALAQPFMIINFTLGGALRGAGDTRFTLLATAIGIWGVRLLLAQILVVNAGMGLIGAWIGMTADMFVRAVIVYWRFSTGHWKKIKV